MNVSEIITDQEGTHKSVMFFCPGCKLYHSVYFEKPDTSDVPIWTWNGSLEKPTFQPSILVRWQFGVEDRKDMVCHSFVTEGNIQFLSDCTHELAGQTVPLEDVDRDG
jgi:hypothetical protein